MSYVLKTSALTKTYKKKTAVKGVSISIEKGDIYGFIGKNGAGKTTLIRMVLGLAMSDSGKVELFGGADLEKSRRKIGAVIENPSFYPHMTALQNMKAQALLLGIKDPSVIDKLLKKVGLDDTGKKKAKNFSLGMKQRLGIALALMGDPEFLCLDEPTNGLDPHGIKEIRNLIKKLNEEDGITVLISSHILPELEKLATRYGIINNGELIDEFSALELEARCKPSLVIKVDDVALASRIIEKDMETGNYEFKGENIIELFDHVDRAGDITKLLTKHGITVESISKSQVDLEEYFLKITEVNKHD